MLLTFAFHSTLIFSSSTNIFLLFAHVLRSFAYYSLQWKMYPVPSHPFARVISPRFSIKWQWTSRFKFSQILGNRFKNGHSSTHNYDPKTGVIFFAQPVVFGVSCWNIHKPYSVENQAIIATDINRMRYASDLNVSFLINFSFFFQLWSYNTGILIV